VTGRKAIPGIEMRLRANPDATLRHTLEDCLYIAQRCRIVVLVIVGYVDLAIGPTSSVDYLHRIYSQQILAKAKRIYTAKQRAKLLVRLSLAA